MNFDFFNNADMLAKSFWLCAIAGTLFFLLRVIMMLFTGDIDDTGDVGDVADTADTNGFDDSSDAAFQIVSINSITAFIMMFGWSGLTAYVQYSLHPFMSMVIAFSAGTLVLLITAYLFHLALKLVSKGAQFSIEKTVGMVAKVYQQIPSNGTGRIQLTIPGDLMRELDAVSDKKEKIESFVPVKIVKVIDANTVSVKRC